MASAPPLHDEVRIKATLWSLQALNLPEGSFEAKFRITLFWAPTIVAAPAVASSLEAAADGILAKWQLLDRSHGKYGDTIVDVPPLALLNATSLTVEGSPELHAVKRPTGRILFRWNCMYSAKLLEPELFSEHALYPFPYDSHFLSIDLDVRYGVFKDVPLKLAVAEDVDWRGRLPHAEVSERVILNEWIISPELDFEVETRDAMLHVRIFIWRKYQYVETNVLMLNA